VKLAIIHPEHLAAWREHRPTLPDELRPALVEVRTDGTHVYDQDHPPPPQMCQV
jgi:hypothetical protein